ncbi:MAG: hypothetical protein GF311_09175 [Candidatus Lokiarchaeota archaeon]|nr:hypothetical protein [Candidatus Lokiarchaeota archaeon]
MVNKMEKIVRINLKTKEIQIETVSEPLEEKYIGGAGVSAALFTNEVSPKTDAFDENNLLIFSVGPFCGTAIPFGGRHFVTAKSPLTNILGESSAGGFLGRELRAAGYNHVIFEGKSQKPVYIFIKNDNIELKDASQLWGKGIHETESIIKKELNDDKLKIASIGPAGENLVRYASIINEGDHAAGRCGLGAVMGSKNLKAIVVKGTNKVEVINRDAVLNAAKSIQQLVKTSPLANIMKDSGTVIHMDNYVRFGDIPIKNYSESRWKGTKSLGYYAMQARGELKTTACFNCPVGCRGELQYEGNWVAWPEYETCAMLGANLYIDDLETLIKWNIVTNNLGIDTISLGSTLGCFLEAAEKNLLDIDLDTLGFEKDSENESGYKIWGSTEPIEKLIKMTANKEGIGKDLAEGVDRFREIHNLPERFDVTGKGLEVPAHEPRSSNLTALDYATSSRGAYHCYEPMHLSFGMNLKEEIGLTEKIDRFSEEDEVVDSVIKIQNSSEAYAASGGCIFGFWFINKITPWVEGLNAITGRDYTVDSWVNAGNNIFNLKRKYNLECGISSDDDTVGKRFFIPIEKGGTKGYTPPLDKFLPKYYQMRGWNEKGIPK